MRRLSDQQIDQVCRDLLSKRRRVTVRGVMGQLRAVFGAAGRTERVATALNRLQREHPLPPATTTSSRESAVLRERLRVAEERATLAETRERKHQDFWADRYAEKLEELQRAHANEMRALEREASDRYLRLYQRERDLARRLSRYEEVEPLGGD